MTAVKEKVERRLGEKLFLKPHRCTGPKCAHTRRSYPPGIHGKKRRRGLSEYGELLHNKQIVRHLYGLDDREVERYSNEASRRTGIFGTNFLRMLETRLDNVVFRLGFAESRRMAKQIVSHGHIQVNGRPVTIPSYRVRTGDTVAINEKSVGGGQFRELDLRLKNYEPPSWLGVDPSKKSGKVVRLPEAEDAGVTVDVTKVKEFYSR